MWDEGPQWQPRPRVCYEPVTIGMAVSTALAAGGSILGGIQSNNAAKREAEMIEADTAVRAADSQKEGDAALSRIRARLAANGISPDAASGALLQSEQAGETAQEVENINRSGRNRASVTRSQGRSDLFSGLMSGAGAIAGGATDIAARQDLLAQRKEQGGSALSGSPSFRGVSAKSVHGRRFSG